MKPNLLVGDWFVSKWEYGFKIFFSIWLSSIFRKNWKESSRGDIIVFKLPGQENINYVKRLVGLPGETIKVVDGLIYVKLDLIILRSLNRVKMVYFLMTNTKLI